MNRALAAALVALALVPACVEGDDADKGEESALPEDGKDDSFRKPTDHGGISFGTPAASQLSDAELFHAWTFELTGDAKVDLTTSYAVLGQRRTDTVLYLYKEGATGWGSYVARNDDYANTTYSQLVRNLGAGRYRALVKGYAAATRGKFKLTVGCAGVGCAPPVVAATCALGTTYGELLEHPGLIVANRNVITTETLGWLDAEAQAQLVAAVRESAHDDVTTAVEALGRVDQQQINVSWVVEPAAQRDYIAFEYGAGDNSYGAVFSRTDGTMAAAIHDGDLYDCAVEPAVCVLPDDDVALRTDPAYRHDAVKVVTSAAGLSAAQQAQVLGALRNVYGAEATTLAVGLAMADDDQVNLRPITHLATGTALTVVEFGAGDTSVGVVYYGATLDRAAVIADLAIGSCTFFE